jgi:GT2 family glycosyltransferase
MDYGIRARRHGYLVVYEPRAKVIHARGHVKINDDKGRVYFRDRLTSYTLRNALNYYHLLIKNHWWKMLLAAYFWNMLGILAAVKNRNPKYAIVKLRGMLPISV